MKNISFIFTTKGEEGTAPMADIKLRWCSTWKHIRLTSLLTKQYRMATSRPWNKGRVLTFQSWQILGEKNNITQFLLCIKELTNTQISLMPLCNRTPLLSKKKNCYKAIKDVIQVSNFFKNRLCRCFMRKKNGIFIRPQEYAPQGTFKY